MDFDAAADELFGMDPADFVAARNARAAEARRAGEPEVADSLKTLKRPSPAAWAVNLLVREMKDDVEGLVALGERLQDAQARLSGDDMRELSRQRQHVVSALARQARSLASRRNRPISEAALRQVEETLFAAMVDSEASGAVLAGRLENPLERSGLGFVAGAGAPSAPSAPSAPTPRPAAGRKPTPSASHSPSDPGPEKAAAEAERRGEIDRLHEELSRLDEASGRAAETERRAMAALEQARSSARDATDLIEKLEAQLEDARSRADDARQAESEADQAHVEARRAATEASRSAAEAGRRLQAVEGES